MSLEKLINDIEGDVQKPSEGSTTPDNLSVEPATQEFALEGFKELSDRLTSLTLEENRLKLKISVESQRSLDKKVALEFFSMIPEFESNASRLTEAPSAFNQRSVLGLLSPYTHESYTRVSTEFITQLLPVLHQAREKVKDHIAFASYFIEKIKELRLKFYQVDPKVVYLGKQLSLWDTQWEELRGINDLSLDYPPYENQLGDKIHRVVSHPHFDFVMKSCAGIFSPCHSSDAIETFARSIAFSTAKLDGRVMEIRRVQDSVSVSGHEVSSVASNTLDYLTELVSAVRLFENGETSFPALLLDYLSFLD